MKLAIGFWISVLILSCNDRIVDPLYDYLKSPSDFRIRPLTGDTALPKKFILSWQNPTDTTGLLKNWIFLDTTDWTSIENDKNRERAKIKLDLEVRHQKQITDNQGKVISLGIIPNRDSILISLAEIKTEEGVKNSGKYKGIPYFILDSSRVDLVEKEYKFALISYFPDRKSGQPRFTSLPLFDNMKPWPILVNIRNTDRSLSLSWNRPKDQVSFFESENDTGLIKGYRLTLGDVKDRNDSNFIPLIIDSIRFTRQGVSTCYGGQGENDPPLKDLIEIESDTAINKKYGIFFPDNRRFHPEPDSNKLSAVIWGFQPLQKYQFQLYPIDSSGNEGKKEAESNTLIMTDTTKPLDITGATITGTTRNSITFVWEPTRDSRNTDNTANQNIAAYYVTIIQQSEEYAVFPPDTALYKLDVGDSRDSVFILKHSKFRFFSQENSSPKYEGILNFLPPGQTYNILIWAVDSTGFNSDTLTFTAETGKAATDISCRKGFKAITADSPFCIEAFEHYENGEFITDVTKNQAEEICRKMGEPWQLSVHLCQPEEWERACRGDTTQFKHKYGIQSVTDDSTLEDIQSSADILQKNCNQGTNDKEMAFQLELRNNECGTNEGVFDLAGNFSEWVAGEDLLFKGGNYLNPEIDIAQLRKTAECGNRSGQPFQYRPVFYPNCVSEIPNLALVYKKINGEDSIFCPPFQRGVRSYHYLKTDDGKKDSSRIIVTFLDSPQKDSIKVNFIRNDSIIKPVKIVVNDSILLLAVNVIPDSIAENPINWAGANAIPDTLFYRPFYFSDEPIELGTVSRHPLLLRETNSTWRIVPEKKLYGYLKQPNKNDFNGKPAKEYFSHEAIGFRCCYSDSTAK